MKVSGIPIEAWRRMISQLSHGDLSDNLRDMLQLKIEQLTGENYPGQVPAEQLKDHKGDAEAWRKKYLAAADNMLLIMEGKSPK